MMRYIETIKSFNILINILVLICILLFSGVAGHADSSQGSVNTPQKIEDSAPNLTTLCQVIDCNSPTLDPKTVKTITGFTFGLITKFEVREFSGDFEKWSKEISFYDPQTLTFRWSTLNTKAKKARWEVYIYKKGDISVKVLASGVLTNIPEPGHWALFNIPYFNQIDANKTQYFKVRIKLLDANSQLIGKPSMAVEVIHKSKSTQVPTVFHFPPEIEGVLSIPGWGRIEAGATLYIKGRYFGSKTGKIYMYGDFPNSPVLLENLNEGWVDDTHIHGVVPVSLNGIKNQSVTIRVETPEGGMSLPFNMEFRGREEMMLPGYNPKVKVVHCGDDGSANACNEVGISASPALLCNGLQDLYTICGGHTNDNAFESKSGFDQYKISLKNGWVFKSYKWETHKTSDDEIINGPIPEPPIGGNEWEPIFNWEVSIAGPFWREAVWYTVTVIIEGPLGTQPW